MVEISFVEGAKQGAEKEMAVGRILFLTKAMKAIKIGQKSSSAPLERRSV